MARRLLTVTVVAFACLTLAVGVVSAAKVKVNKDTKLPALRATHLLDRGADTSTAARSAVASTKSGRANNTLMLNAAAGPGAVGATTYLWFTGNAAAYQGNYFGAPADFPSAWFPFDVTGVYAWHWVTGTVHPSATWLGAGHIPVGLETGFGPSATWPGGGVQHVTFGNGLQTGVVGAQGNLPAAVPVATGGCACGLRTYGTADGFGQDGVGMNLGAGGNLHWAQWGTVPTYTQYYYSRNTATPSFPQYDGIAGCYVSGATVPVELMSFDAE